MSAASVPISSSLMKCTIMSFILVLALLSCETCNATASYTPVGRRCINTMYATSFLQLNLWHGSPTEILPQAYIEGWETSTTVVCIDMPWSFEHQKRTLSCRCCSSHSRLTFSQSGKKREKVIFVSGAFKQTQTLQSGELNNTLLLRFSAGCSSLLHFACSKAGARIWLPSWDKT